MSNATPVKLSPVRISWNGATSQHPPQTPLKTPAFPIVLSTNPGFLEPVAPFYQHASFIDLLLHSNTFSPGPTMPAESSLDDLESDDESEGSSDTSEDPDFSVERVKEEARHLIDMQHLFYAAEIVAHTQVDDAQKQLQEYQQWLSTTTVARQSAYKWDSRFREFIRQHELDIDMNAITIERSCAFRETDFYKRASPSISRFHQSRVQVDMARIAGLLAEDCDFPRD